MSNNNNNNRGRGGNPFSGAKSLANVVKKQVLADIRAAGGKPVANRKRRSRKPKSQKRMGRNGMNKGAGFQGAAAAAYATGQKSGQAQIYRNSVDSCRIVHRELIASVVGTVAFTVAQTFALNPGVQATFPWLSNEAAGWERYRFNKLKFCYYTRTGSNIPGSVMLAPDYDAADAAPIGEQIASSFEDTEEDAPWKDIKCVLQQRELMGDMKEKTIRNGTLAANLDIKTYDAGNLFLCTMDGTAVNWGKLWVEYDVTLITPQVPSGGFQAEGTLFGSTANTAANPFGTAGTQSMTGPIVLSVDTTGVITIANVQIGQEILVVTDIVGTVITAIAQGTLVGLTLVTQLFSGFQADALKGAVNSTYLVTALNPTLRLTETATTVTSARAIVTVLAPIPVSI